MRFIHYQLDERHYWIGTLYTHVALRVRRSQATYFTPPAVADASVDFAIDAGFNLEKTTYSIRRRVGRLSFPPLRVEWQRLWGLAAGDAAYRLNGIEIDVGLAALSPPDCGSP